MSARRPAGMSIHDWQHLLITERNAAVTAAPTRSSVDRQRRRELAKTAKVTVRGHLAQFHGKSGLDVTLSVTELSEMHDKLHAEDA